MGLFDWIGRLVRANLDDMVSQPENSETVIELKIIKMQEYLVELRQNVASAIATQKRAQQQYNQNLSQAQQWESRAKLALQKGDENLAHEALQRKKEYLETAHRFKEFLPQHTVQVDILKRHLINLESIICEAKTQKNLLKLSSQLDELCQQLDELRQQLDKM
jgi:phage shock protein A